MYSWVLILNVASVFSRASVVAMQKVSLPCGNGEWPRSHTKVRSLSMLGQNFGWPMAHNPTDPTQKCIYIVLLLLNRCMHALSPVCHEYKYTNGINVWEEVVVHSSVSDRFYFAPLPRSRPSTFMCVRYVGEEPFDNAMWTGLFTID